jgi:hypothetical protein
VKKDDRLTPRPGATASRKRSRRRKSGPQTFASGTPTRPAPAGGCMPHAAKHGVFLAPATTLTLKPSLGWDAPAGQGLAQAS